MYRLPRHRRMRRRVHSPGQIVTPTDLTAGMLRARGVARGIGALPQAFDLPLTTLASESTIVPSLQQTQTTMVKQAATLKPAAIEQLSAEYVPEMSATATLPGAPQPLKVPMMDWMGSGGGSGVPQASADVYEERLHNGELEAPETFIDYSGDTATAGPITENGSKKSKAWPWWVWALIAGGVGMGLYGIVRK